MTPFQVGMKVQCVGAVTSPASYGEVYPKVGEVYTIRDIEPEYNPDNIPYGSVTLRFEEIINPSCRYRERNAECQFNCANFRPLVKTSIEIFTSMLAPKQKERKREPAA